LNCPDGEAIDDSRWNRNNFACGWVKILYPAPWNTASRLAGLRLGKSSTTFGTKVVLDKYLVRAVAGLKTLLRARCGIYFYNSKHFSQNFFFGIIFL
jgi:hypothetical protein